MNTIRALGALAALFVLALPASGGRPLREPHPDHHEFEASVAAPFQGAARAVSLEFRFPDGGALLFAPFRLDVVDARGATVRSFFGEARMESGLGRAQVEWDGRTASGATAPDGFYDLRLSARTLTAVEHAAATSHDDLRTRVQRHLARAGGEAPAWAAAEIRVGNPPLPDLLPAKPLPTARHGFSRFSRVATGGLPYTVYYGNFHSQTNHTDGGGNVATCGGAEIPQQGQFGPNDAWEMMRTQAGGDILVTSEHNHMYDGSTSLNLAADATSARAKFASGLQLAADYRAAHPEFLALYGTEWGVISDGGHLNVFNPDGLATWEVNGSAQLLGDFLVAKSDYAAMYALMKQRGWVGQFNHPANTGQFQIGGVSLAYNADGDEAMALCEFLNTSGFSTNVTESDTSRNSFEPACQRLLEAGYHVAPASNQDNHCANWGLSYTNRTGVLIPTGTPLSLQSFVAALKARRTFATLDKTSQIVLTTSSGALMGDRIDNVNGLTLNVQWASANPSRSVTRVRVMEGVPGRNGAVSQLSDGASTLTFTPAVGQHFYYAVITQDNGDKLWSAPIWVNQLPGLVAAQIVQPASNIEVQSGALVSFSGAATTSNTGIATHAWDFGDGSNSTGPSVSHAFSNPGAAPVTFAVTYTATDDKGVSGTATRVVTVDPDVRFNTPPTIGAIANVSTQKDAPVGPVEFPVSDAETPAVLLDVTALSLNKALVPDENIQLSGDGVLRSISLLPAPGQTGKATILVTVTDGGGAFETASFVVTVGTAQPRLILSQYYEGLSSNKWIEITNVGAGAYDYTASPMYLGLWTNPFTGGTTYTVTPIQLAIAPGASVLYRNASAVVPGSANLTGTGTSAPAVNFNGDDVTYLSPLGTADAAGFAARTDVIGENSAAWATSVSGGAGKDRSFVRNRGSSRPNAIYTPSEWTQVTLSQVDNAAVGVTERLGVHVFNQPPVISDVPAQDLLTNGSTGPVAFTVGDAETPADLLSVAASSSNEVLVPPTGVALGGTGASRTVAVTPVADQSGTAVVTLTVTDGDGSTAESAFLVSVNPQPSGVARVTVSPATAFLPNGQSQMFTANVTGIGNFSTRVVWSASGGAIQQNGLYTPPTTGGPYTITATSLQDSSRAGTALVFTNRPPVANAQGVTTPEDTAIAIALAGSDPDGNPITYAVLTQPLHGALTGTAPSLTYTPAPDYNGPDAFTFITNDGSADSQAATVSITVAPVNDAPVAFAQARSTNEDTPLALALVATDVDKNALAYAIVAPPAHGALSGTPPAVTYTPAQDYNGADSFTFKANDGSLDSNTATVSLTIVPVNDPPVAKATSRTVAEDATRSFTLTATDVEGDPLTFAIVSPPAHGTLTGTLPNVTYAPFPNYNGPDSFTFKANDGQADSLPAKATITVTPVNDAPVAASSTRSTNEDTPVTVTLAATDVDGDVLTYTVVTQPAHGTLGGVAPALTYTPAANYNGADSFTWKANDGTVDSGTATVSLTVNAVNDAPAATPQSLSVAEDGSLSVTLAGTDVDSTTLTFRVVAPPANGALTGAPPNLTYAPAHDYNGPDSFTFVADDGALSSAPAAISITVTPVNDAPVALDQSVQTDEDTAVVVHLTGRDVDDDPLTFHSVLLPAHGALSGTGPDITYTPAANYNGSDSFTFVASDGAADSLLAATVSITVKPVNDAPVAQAQSLTTPEDTPLAITLHATDADLDTLSYAIVTPPAHGTLVLALPDLTYTPAANYNGSDSFTFAASDGALQSPPATISIAVTAVNDAPVAASQNVTTLENQAVAITLSAADVEGDPLTWAVQAPAHGTLTGVAPTLTYTPNTNYSGQDSFTFTVNDTHVSSAAATVSISIGAVNQPPVANAQSLSMPEDTLAFPVTLTGSDPESSPLTFATVTLPQHGTLTGTPPSLTYKPAADYFGADGFTFTASDGTLTSQPAAISITVTPVNDAPVAKNTSRSVTEDTPRSFTLAATDADGDPLTFIITQQPGHGTLIATALPDVTYIPNANYFGTDNFKFKVNDGTVDSNVATATLTIAAVNDAPVANPQSVSTPEDVPLAITLSGSDVDSTVLTYAISAQPLHGTLSGTPPSVIYNPAKDWFGTDTFSFTLTDNAATPLTSAPAVVTVTVTPLNDAPVATAQAVSVNEDTSVNIVLSGTDAEQSPLTFAVVAQPAHGFLFGAPPDVQYTPLPDYNGPDSFTFTASDGSLTSAAATVSITVQPVNDAPTTGSVLTHAPIPLTTPEDTPLPLSLGGSDPDGDPLTFVIDAQPRHGALSGTGGSVTYTPAPDYNGPDAFTFHVSDGALDSEPVTVDLGVTPVNDAPLAEAQAVTTAEDSALTFTLTGRDVEQSALSFTLLAQPAHGALSGTPPIVTYTPAADYHGPDSFTFKVNDGALDSAPATVAITVTSVNDAPAAAPLTLSTAEDTALPVALSGADPDGDSITYALVTLPAHGTLTGSPPSLTYTPAANYNGADSFTYKTSDGALDSAPAAVALTVTPVNDAPVAKATSRTVYEDTPRSFVLTGTDVDGDALTFRATTQPSHGTLSGALPVVIYTPAPNYHGSDSFRFVVNDGAVDSVQATVSLTIKAVNDPPLAQPQALSTAEDTPLALSLRGDDVDLDPLHYEVVSPPSHGTLSGTLPDLVYTPDRDWSGDDAFSFTVGDGQLVSEAQPIVISVTPVDDAPVALAQEVATSEDTPVHVALAGFDAEGASLVYAVSTPPAHGMLTGTPPDLTYVPARDYNGQDAFSFVVNDGAQASPAATVTVAIAPVNDPPSAIPQALRVVEGRTLHVTLTGSDPDGDALTFAVTAQPQHGTLGADVTYTPAPGFTGDDSFSFTASDGAFVSAPADVTVRVLPLPAAHDRSVGLVATRTLHATLSGEVSGTATYEVVTHPAQGILLLLPTGEFTYTPSDGARGTDSFTFRVTDDNGPSAPAKFAIRLNSYDLDADAALDGADLGLLAAALGGTDPAFDLDGDGAATDADLALLLVQIRSQP